MNIHFTIKHMLWLIRWYSNYDLFEKFVYIDVADVGDFDDDDDFYFKRKES